MFLLINIVIFFLDLETTQVLFIFIIIIFFFYRVVNIDNSFRRVCNPAFKTLPIHLFVETGLKLMDILEKIDNKPVEIVNLMQR